MNKTSTMKDIALAMNVSVVSVSKALAGKDGVSESMRAKIIEKANELGYAYEQNLKQDEFRGNIGILVADRFFNDNSFYSNMYRSILMKSNEVGFSAILEIVMPDEENNGTLPNIINTNKVDGVIFMGEISQYYIKVVTQTKLPFMLLDFYDDKNANDSVVSDSIFGSYQLTSHLIKTGHKKIGFVGTATATTSILDRYLGFYKALLKNNMPLNSEWVIPDRDNNGRFIELKLPKDMPQAFVCNCDEVAYLLVEQLKNSGYQVPGDISVVGFDDFRFATLCSPQLTTFRVDVDAMGEAVVGQLVRKIKHKRYTKGRTIISGIPVYRDSTQDR